MRWTVVLLVMFVGGVASAKEPTRPSRAHAWDGVTLTAHEWGTFTSVQGSDGSVLGGLTHEDRGLPSFVHDLRDRTSVTGRSPKMETPVVYFYAPEPKHVRCCVRFPRGAITQWYPAATAVNAGPPIDELKHGFIVWGGNRDLRVEAPGAPANFPAVDRDDPWRFCREVAANPLTVTGPGDRMESERCLFYRGLGDFPLPFEGRILSERTEGSHYHVDIDLRAAKGTPQLEHVFIVHVRDGKAGYAVLPHLTTHRSEITIELRDQHLANELLVAEMAQRLTHTGLFRDEAFSMARTWQHAWFHDEGTRVLYTLPQAFVDKELPLRIRTMTSRSKPQIDKWKVVRTFVGRTELLSPQTEAALQATAHDLAHGTPAKQAAAKNTLARWGRFAAPYVQRVLALTTDDAVRAKIAAELASLTLRR